VTSYPKIHNAMWPGVVGKGTGDAEPVIAFDTLLDLTAAAEVDGVRFDGVGLILHDAHVSVNSTSDQIKAVADKIAAKDLQVGLLVAPIWSGDGGGSAMGSREDRERFLSQVRKACAIGQQMRELGIRPDGGVRIDSSASVREWDADPEEGTRRIAETFREAGRIAEEHGEYLVAEGEICWGGMHSWRQALHLLELVDMPGVVEFQADMAHTMLFTLGYNREQDRLLPEDYDFTDPGPLDEAYRTVASALRPWTRALDVAQNDGTVFGSGSHDTTGRHCQVDDPNGKLDVVKHAGYWLRDEHGELTRTMRTICWDGCMFPNAVMTDPATWRKVLGQLIAVRDAHGWNE
jgi:sugar phosphate isomerase/epimerase